VSKLSAKVFLKVNYSFKDKRASISSLIAAASMLFANFPGSDNFVLFKSHLISFYI